jgi:hypothetical protein
MDSDRFAARGFHNFTSTALLPRHRWYYLKEGFSASLVEEAIKCRLSGARRVLRILEPFCGTGTAPLTAALGGHLCTAIEVNPFLAFTASVKTIPGRWRASQFVRNLDKVMASDSRGVRSSLEGFSSFTPSEGADKWLFNIGVLRRFEALKQAIRRFGKTYEDAMMLSALVAALSCCNAKRDGKALRYRSRWRERDYSAGDLMKQFVMHSAGVLQDALELPVDPYARPEIRVGDSRAEIPRLDDDQFDLVVTSPPYLNSADYSDVYRPELFLGDWVTNNNELRQLRLSSVRSHIQVKWEEETSFESPLLEPIIEALSNSNSLWDVRLPKMVTAYFDDIWRLFTAMRPKIRVNGEIWIVVSTSSYGGVHIPVDSIIADAACQAGFSLVSSHLLRYLRTAGQQWAKLNVKGPPLRETLLILKNG